MTQPRLIFSSIPDQSATFSLSALAGGSDEEHAIEAGYTGADWMRFRGVNPGADYKPQGGQQIRRAWRMASGLGQTPNSRSPGVGGDTGALQLSDYAGRTGTIWQLQTGFIKADQKRRFLGVTMWNDSGGTYRATASLSDGSVAPSTHDIPSGRQWFGLEFAAATNNASLALDVTLPTAGPNDVVIALQLIWLAVPIEPARSFGARRR